MKLKKQFEWRELSEGGLLKKLREHANYCGFYESIGGPWDTEEEAVAALEGWIEKNNIHFYGGEELILMTVYQASDKYRW